MSDFDAQLPVRTIATEFTTEVANASGTTINPATEDGHLATIDTNVATLSGAVSGAKFQDNIAQVGGVAISLGQKTMANSFPVVVASDQSDLPTNLDKVGGSAVTLGQKVMASSIPVVLSSDQSAVPVTFSNSTVELPQYNTAAAVASNATSTHSYTPGSTVSLDGFDASASGRAKWELQYGTTGSETTKAVVFSSVGQLQVTFRFPNPISITSAMTVKIIRTNLDNQAQDLYSTIQVH